MSKPKQNDGEKVVEQVHKNQKQRKRDSIMNFFEKPKHFAKTVLPWLIIGGAIVFYYAYQIGHDQGTKDQRALTEQVSELVILSKQTESKE